MPEVTVRPSGRGDRWWLLRAGWSPGLVGEQYHWAEAPLQLVIAPLRALRWPPGPSSIIEVDGAPAGYIGRNPLSGNLEYWLRPWARGGTGSRAIEAFLVDWQGSRDRRRRFYVARKNARSRAALLHTLERLGWVEGTDYEVTEGRYGASVWVEPGSTRTR